MARTSSLSNDEYWEYRANLRMTEIERGSVEYLQNINNLFAQTSKQIEGDIEAILQSYMRNGQLGREEALKLLSEPLTSFEIERLRSQILLVDDADVRAKLLARLNAPAYKARIDRLQAIELSTRAELAKLAAGQIEQTTAGLNMAAGDAFSRTVFDLQKGTGLAYRFAQQTDKQVEEVLKNKWAGDHYSDRIWSNTDQIAQRIPDIVQKNMATGRSWRRCIGEVDDLVQNGGMYSAERILRTETAYVANEMEAAAYEDAGIERYKFIATLDSRTSAICQEHDGKVYDLKDREPGTNYPPLHPHCRSTTIAHFDDKEVAGLGRRARDPKTGESYKVPANTSYKQWQEGLAEYQKGALRFNQQVAANRTSDPEQYKEYLQRLGTEIPDTFEGFVKTKYLNEKEWGILKAQYQGMGYYEKAISVEPQITKHVVETAEEVGMDVAGLEYRIKGKDSYLRKIRTEYKAKGNTFEIKDILRYTYTAPPTELAGKTLLSIESQRLKGYNTVVVKNTWLDKNNPYKGINTFVKSPNDQTFELQYHTEQSFALKNGAQHSLYEKWRSIENKASAEATGLMQQMHELSTRLVIPEGITGVR